MGVRTILATTFSTAFMLAVATQAAPAGSWLEMNFWMSGPRYDGSLPACNDAGALGRISGRFAQKEGTFWVSDLAITGFDKVREIAFRPWGHQAIPRRYCSARVTLSNGISTVVVSREGGSLIRRLVVHGKVLGDVAALASGARVEKGPADYALLAVGLIATLVVTTFVTRLARKALRQSALEEPTDA